MSMEKRNSLAGNLLERIIFSPMMLKANRARKIAYIATMVALSIVCNMYFEFKLGSVQYSFTTAICAIIGVFIGAGSGFIACFLGDAIGFIANPFGTYAPWIGIATGGIAFISGIIIHFFKSEKQWVLYLKMAAVSIITFVICSVGINTTFLWLTYYNEMTYFEYFVYRYLALGQLVVSGINYALFFIVVPLVKRIPFFRDLNI